MNPINLELNRQEVEELVNGLHSDHFSVLGLHDSGAENKWLSRCFLPGAIAVDVIDSSSGSCLGTLRKTHDAGLFEGDFLRSGIFSYQLKVSYPFATELLEDPYRFWSLLDPQELESFHAGHQKYAQALLGARPKTIDGVNGVLFSVWAPNARRVAVVGDFNNWDSRKHGMRYHFRSGVWEIFLPGVGPGALYKYAIHDSAGKLLPLKSDPYAREMELRPGTSSRVSQLDGYSWNDEAWMKTRKHRHHSDRPLSIYEVHLGSFRRADENHGHLSYRELAEELIPYVKSLGFTHLQLMPINEHPFGGSWGYQPIGMYAPTSRFGTPHDFRYFVDAAHQSGIGVLLDWVPGHFPSDENGLGQFDGSHLYEHSDPRKGYHPDWNTHIFNYERSEVSVYLLSNALYWLSEFHIDGLRFDAVASMIYLDYSREEGQWEPNIHGGRENLAAVELLKRINSQISLDFPDTLAIAEESTSWPGVTHSLDNGGLGFAYKWNLGWMNDTLKYMSRDPIHRQYHANEITFGLTYAFSERFVLPLSHDEVVHEKKSLIEKMPGDEWQKFANLRAYFGLMWAHPGKKLLFMGGEFAQRREWAQQQSLDWHLLEHANHKGVQALIKDLNDFYTRAPAMWSCDHDGRGFQWTALGEQSGAIFVFARKSPEHSDNSDDSATLGEVIVVCNLTPVVLDNYRIGVSSAGCYREVINTDSEFYGGSGQGNLGKCESQAVESHGHANSLSICLPPLATLYLTQDVS